MQREGTRQGYSLECAYDVFGNLVDYSGTWSSSFAYGGAFGYQSDVDSGLMLLGHRYYDASTGRFLSRDPVGDGSNWYVYCGNNPIKFSDRDGLAPRLSSAPVEMVWVDHGVPGIGIQESSGWGALEIIHSILDVAGTFDPTPICDGINAIIYVAEGDWYNASISAGGMVPYVGDAAKVGRGFSKVAKFADDAGRHAGFKKQVQAMSEASKRKSARNLERRIAEYEEKLLKEPKSRDTKHWKKEIETFKEQLAIVKEALNE